MAKGQFLKFISVETLQMNFPNLSFSALISKAISIDPNFVNQ